MKKFSNLKPEISTQDTRKKTLFKDQHLTVVNYENISIITDRDVVVCIPYLIQQNKIILRQEYIPAYKYADDKIFMFVLLVAELRRAKHLRKLF